MESSDSPLARYRKLVASLPVPTPTQMEAFAEFVAGAHSWYKHLPLCPPGVPFHFFLDPAGGMELVAKPSGKIEAVDRTGRGFHYSSIPTKEYRERFGFLGYSRSAGTVAATLEADGSQRISSDLILGVFDAEAGTFVAVPQEVLDAGRSFVSGIVHTVGADPQFWQISISYNWPLQLPEESGGQDTLRQIRDRCRILSEDPSRLETLSLEDVWKMGEDENLTWLDYPLYRLLEPERRRQRAGMVAAMQRVLDLVAAS